MQEFAQVLDRLVAGKLAGGQRLRSWMAWAPSGDGTLATK
jgi:hypothetical protein